MRFFLGTHHTGWLFDRRFAAVDLFISHRSLSRRSRLRPAITWWALDSGGFTQLTMREDGWSQDDEAPYAEAADRYFHEIGQMVFCSPQDWMCEPWLLRNRSVPEHQERTVANLLRLREIAPHLPWAPVLQGWELDDYHRCVELYASAGIDLAAEPTVGLGSVCRRQATGQIGSIVEAMHREGIRGLHGFGVKRSGIIRYGSRLNSSDSLAWSYTARRSGPLHGCRHKACNNCPTYALRWRASILRAVDQPQLELFSHDELSLPRGSA